MYTWVFVMDEIKMRKIFALFGVICLLIITSLGSIATSYDIKECNNLDLHPESSKNILLRASPTTQKIILKNIYSLNKVVSAEELSTEDIRITDSSDDEYLPSLVVNRNNAIISYESSNGSSRDVYFKNSKDYGITWSGGLPFSMDNSNKYSFLNNHNFTYPSLGIRPGFNKAYGTIVSDYNGSSIYFVLEIPDIGANDIEIKTSILDWSEQKYNSTTNDTFSFWGFSDTNTIYYDSTKTPWVIALIGSTNYSTNPKDPLSGEGPCTNSPMFCFNDLTNPTEWITIAWFPEIQNCDNLSVTNQYGSDMIYGVCEINNGGNQDLLFFKGKPGLWAAEDASLINKTITSSENLLHPKIAVKDNNIYIAAETESQGIILYHSSNGGDNWSSPINVTKDILPSESQAQYPDIIVNQTHLVSTFIESGNLSITKSNNSGNNWTDPVKINSHNNSVVSGYSFTDLVNQCQIAWVDNRNTDNDIYYYVGYTPTIDIKLINFSLTKEILLFKTNNTVSVTFKNQGDGYAEDVRIDIVCEFDEGNATIITKYITHINKGETRTINFPLFKFSNSGFFQALIDYAGIQNITVTIDSNHAYEYGDSFIDNILKKPVEYEDIFPILYPLENVFKSLKNINE